MFENTKYMFDKLFEYNLWANLYVIGLCQELSEEQLGVELKGVFGRIKPTITHILQGEGGYIRRLTGVRPWAEDLDWDGMSMGELLDMAKISSNRLLEIASQVEPDTPHAVEFQGTAFTFFSWTVALQALYHGIEHRTQIKLLLTELGIEHNDLSIWEYTDAL